MQVPGFLARQFYVGGSLRNTPTGFSLQAKNPLGDGVLVGVGSMSVDGQLIHPSRVSAVRTGDPQVMRASDVSRTQPIHVRKGDTVTLHIEGPQLPPGSHKLEVELHEINVGALRFSISDKVAATSSGG